MDRLSADALLWHDRVPQLDEALCDAIRDAIATVLTERQRSVVEGYFFEGLSQSELASRLGVSQQVVHKCLFGSRRDGRPIGGALKRLRAALLPLVPAAGAGS